MTGALQGQVALVTGAARGIGRAIAHKLATEGADVAVNYYNSHDEAEALCVELRSLGRRAFAIQGSVGVPDSVDEIFTAIREHFDRVDIVVSNAGIASFGSLDELPTSEWDRSFAINSRGHFLVARSAMRIMKQQRTGGSIVFNASKNVTAPGKEFGAYSVSKAAEAQLCRIVALEGGEFGIRANMLNPDAIFGGSRFWSDEMRAMRAQNYGIDASKLPDYYRNRTLLKTEVTADDVAEAALFLAGPRSAKTTGAMLPVDGGVKEAFPR